MTSFAPRKTPEARRARKKKTALMLGKARAPWFRPGPSKKEKPPCTAPAGEKEKKDPRARGRPGGLGGGDQPRELAVIGQRKRKDERLGRPAAPSKKKSAGRSRRKGKGESLRTRSERLLPGQKKSLTSSAKIRPCVPRQGERPGREKKERQAAEE